jgi:hypothetical protein
MPVRTPVNVSSLTGSRRLSISRSGAARSGAAMMAAKSGTPYAEPRLMAKPRPAAIMAAVRTAVLFVVAARIRFLRLYGPP